MTVKENSRRLNQKLRTRKELLQAAARLMAKGRSPSFEEIAEEAMVSRATAYRYFPGVEALLIEAALDVAAPEAETVLGAGAPDDPAARLERVNDAFEAMIAANEPALRAMLASSLGQGAGDAPAARQNRRTPLIQAALAPAHGEFTPASLKLLTRAMALVIGTESMLAFKDVLQISASEARKVKRWMIHALVEAARSKT